MDFTAEKSLVQLLPHSFLFNTFFYDRFICNNWRNIKQNSISEKDRMHVFQLFPVNLKPFMIKRPKNVEK